jgi:hypothetical protein
MMDWTCMDILTAIGPRPISPPKVCEIFGGGLLTTLGGL